MYRCLNLEPQLLDLTKQSPVLAISLLICSQGLQVSVTLDMGNRQVFRRVWSVPAPRVLWLGFGFHFKMYSFFKCS